MRTLKKSLALVLVLVMMFSFAAIGANAASLADFTDASKVTKDYADAMDLFVALGVVNGTTATTLDPQGNYTRAQSTRLAAVVSLGVNLAGKLSCTAAPFDDVAANHWAAGTVAYCVNEGIVAGVGDGKFDPDAALSGYAWAKELLVVLGKDGKDYLGEQWAINVAKDAFAMGIFTNVASAATNDPITREQAVQMAYNALFVGTKTVTETATKYVLTATKASLAEISGNYYDTFDGAKAAAKAKDSAAVYGSDYTVASMAITSEKVEGSLADTVFKLAKTTTPDKFGRPGNAYAVDGETLTFTAIAPVLTYNGGVQGKKIYADLSLTKVPTITAVEDGEAKTSNIAVTASSTDVFGGNGSAVEVYKTATGKYTIVVINTYFDTVKSVKVTTDATTGVKTTTLALTGGLTSTKLTSFAKKDAVLYTKAGSELMSIEKAEIISGSLTKAVNSVQYTIGGTVYTIGKTSNLNNAAVVGADNVNMGKTVSYYVDGTNLMAAVDTTAAATAGTYIKVLAAATPTTSSDYIAGAGQYTGKVYGILSDGTYGEYTVNYSADEIEGNAAATANTIYAYELNAAGQMILDTTVTSHNTTAAITAGATTAAANSTQYILNSNTSFIFYTQKSNEATIASLTAKKGNANSGIVASGATLVIENNVVIAVYAGGTYVDGTEVVDVAYVDASTKTTTTESEVTAAGTVNTTVYSYTAYTAGGDEITLTSKTLNLSVDAVYKYNTDNTIGAAAVVVTEENIALYGSTVKVNGQYYSYNIDMVNFLCENDTALADGQKVVAIANAAGNALTHMWVLEDAEVE